MYKNDFVKAYIYCYGSMKKRSTSSIENYK